MPTEERTFEMGSVLCSMKTSTWYLFYLQESKMVLLCRAGDVGILQLSREGALLFVPRGLILFSLLQKRFTNGKYIFTSHL